MRCEELRDLLHAYVDGELDLVRNLRIESHLETCPACAACCQELQALRKALGDHTLYRLPPAGFQERIRAALQSAHKPAPKSADSPKPPLPRSSFFSAHPVLAWGLAGVLVLLALWTWGIVPWPSFPSAEDLLAREVVASHVRSLLPRHLLDREESEQQPLKRWFSGQVDFSPSVRNLADKGFPLLGGRLDYLHNRKAAVLVYKHKEHVINVYVRPANGEPALGPQELSQQGYQMFHWNGSELAYWVISDLDHCELRDFVNLVRE